MQIALDATPLVLPGGGVTRYTAELSRALAETEPGDAVWLLSDQRFALPADPPPNLRAGSPPRSLAERRWWLWGLSRELARRSIDVFHGTDFAVPYLGGRPAVMTVHDLSPWSADAGADASARVRQRTPLLLWANRAAFVITPTEAIRREVRDRFRFPAERIVAIPLAAADFFRPVPPAPGRYLLYVGALERRKNLALLLDAWRAARRTHPDLELWLAGQPRSDFPAPPPEPGLRLLGFVPDADLPPLYSGAVAVVYPSLYEGFGLPVLEAMQCGALVIASRDPAVMEAAGEAAVLAAADDGPAWTEAIAAAAAGGLAGRRELALARAAEFSWRDTARRTREVYAEAQRRHAR